MTLFRWLCSCYWSHRVRVTLKRICAKDWAEQRPVVWLDGTGHVVAVTALYERREQR